MHVTEAILTRRSHKLFAGEALPDADLKHLLELAIWAPNHKITEPWRFSVLPKRSFPQLRAAVQAAADSEKARAKLPKLMEIIDGAGAAIAVRQVCSPDNAEREREDFAACAIACQHIQLGAWERGWASYWTTSAAFLGGAMAEFWHVAADETLIGVIFLGKAAIEMPAVRRHSAESLAVWL
jgi:nitroreductase